MACEAYDWDDENPEISIEYVPINAYEPTSKLLHEVYNAIMKDSELATQYIPVNENPVFWNSSIELSEEFKKHQQEQQISPTPKTRTKPMTKLHHQLIQLLLPVCLETTAKMRAKYEASGADNDKLTEEQKNRVKKLEAYILLQRDKMKENVSALFIEQILNLVVTTTAFATEQPYLLNALKRIKTSKHDVYDPLTVIVRFRSHNAEVDKYIPLNTPLIVLHGVNKKILQTNGIISGQVYNQGGDSYEQEVRCATDEEIEECLTNLTTQQLRFITSNDLFAPIVAPLFEEEDELVVEKNEDGGEDKK